LATVVAVDEHRTPRTSTVLGMSQCTVRCTPRPEALTIPLADANAPDGDGAAVLWPPQAPAAKATPMTTPATAMTLALFMSGSLARRRDRARPRIETVMQPRRP